MSLPGVPCSCETGTDPLLASCNSSVASLEKTSHCFGHIPKMLVCECTQGTPGPTCWLSPSQTPVLSHLQQLCLRRVVMNTGSGAGAKRLLTLPPTLLPSFFVRVGRNGAVLHRKGQPSTVSLFSILGSGFPALWGTGEPRVPSPLQSSPDSRSGSAAQEPHSLHSSPEFKFSLSSPCFSSI